MELTAQGTLADQGVAYFVAQAVDKVNVDLAPIAIVGALGDMQDKYDQRMFGGLNMRILEDATNSGLLTVKKDLVFFGRETRPIHKTLSSATSPFIPGISGEEDRSLAFLASLGIKAREGDKWRLSGTFPRKRRSDSVRLWQITCSRRVCDTKLQTS